MSRKIFFTCLLAISIFFSTGDVFAAYSIDKIDVFDKVPLQTAEIMPSKAALNAQRPRVIVFNFEDNQWRGGGEITSDKIIKELSDTGVTLVDRTLAVRLRKEIELAETKGSFGYKGQHIADYAITGKITQARISHTYDENTGKRNATADVSVTIKISQLPSLQTVKIINEDGRETIEGNSAPGNLLSDAVQKVIVKAHTHLKNQFAPVGYVLEHRIYEKTHIFKSSLGKIGGAQPGLKVQFIKLVPDKNPLTGVVSVDHVVVAEGEITEHLTDSYSLIVIKDDSSVDKINLGDQVNIFYKNSIWDHLKML